MQTFDDPIFKRILGSLIIEAVWCLGCYICLYLIGVDIMPDSLFVGLVEVFIVSLVAVIAAMMAMITDIWD